MIESHVFGTKRSYRMQERNGQIEWVSNDQHLIRFNNLLQMWQVVNATTSNQIGEGKLTYIDVGDKKILSKIADFSNIIYFKNNVSY